MPTKLFTFDYTSKLSLCQLSLSIRCQTRIDPQHHAMLSIPNHLVSSLDLQTGLKVTREVLVTLQESQPRILGTGILHLVHPSVSRGEYGAVILRENP